MRQGHDGSRCETVPLADDALGIPGQFPVDAKAKRPRHEDCLPFLCGIPATLSSSLGVTENDVALVVARVHS